MAAGDAPATFSELRTDFLEGIKERTGVTALNTIANRYLNSALQDMHQERWFWQERRSLIRTNPPYTTGTIDVAVTSLTTRRTVTGTSTAWNTTNSFGDVNGIGVGAKMTLGSENGIVHEILTVDSDTGITLTTSTPYTGTSALDDAGYAIYQDEYALASDFLELIDTRFFDEDRTIQLIGARELYYGYARNTVRQAPKYATLIELGPSGAVTLRRRVLFAPAPDKTYLIPYRYYTANLALTSAGVGGANLSGDTDEPIIARSFRKALVYKAQELWSRDRKDDARANDYKASYEALILRARQQHGPADDRPRLVPRTRSYDVAARRPYTAVGRRLTTGPRWDQMAE